MRTQGKRNWHIHDNCLTGLTIEWSFWSLLNKILIRKKEFPRRLLLDLICAVYTDGRSLELLLNTFTVGSDVNVFMNLTSLWYLSLGTGGANIPTFFWLSINWRSIDYPTELGTIDFVIWMSSEPSIWISAANLFPGHRAYLCNYTSNMLFCWLLEVARH